MVKNNKARETVTTGVLINSDLIYRQQLAARALQSKGSTYRYRAPKIANFGPMGGYCSLLWSK